MVTLHINRGVNKEDFGKVWGGTLTSAFTGENICSAFKKTGIWPYNPDMITLEQMKLAEVTSTQSTFPLPQSSPVICIAWGWT